MNSQPATPDLEQVDGWPKQMTSRAGSLASSVGDALLTQFRVFAQQSVVSGRAEWGSQPPIASAM